MPIQRVQITRPIRRVIREARGEMSRREAAKRADLSEIWWRQVETGRAEFATVRTVAKMCLTAGVKPAALRAIGEEAVADLMEEPAAGLPEPGTMEAHIMATPGLTDTQRTALVVMAQALRVKV
jgi:hypothetical protein